MPAQIDFDPAVDYYKVLGVSEKATADEIKKAYRKLAKANHPDSTGGDKTKEQRFKQISVAYDVLGDAKKKATYDQIRAGGFDPRMGGMPGGATYTYAGGQGGPGVFDLGDLFSQFFGGASGARGGRVRVERMDFEPGGRNGRNARGRTAQREPVDDAEFEQRVKASDGTWLRVEGGDVHSDVRIPFDRAILGTVASIATIDGKADVKVPPGTASGRKLRLKGKGVAGRSGQPGDHYVTVQIDVPKDLDEEGKKLLVQLVQRLRKHGQNS